MRDFTLFEFKIILECFKKQKYDFQTFSGFLGNSDDKVIVMRHDVDRLPINALVMAGLEKDFGIKGSYYFRAVPESFDEEIIRKISEMGHEIGFHYESVDKVTTQERSNQKEMGHEIGFHYETVSAVTSRKLKVESDWNRDEIIDRAYELFCEELEKFRKIADIKTICMHGSPRGKRDNRIIWEKYNYRDLGIIGEPYFDVDWNEVGYLTDTGRRWNGDKFSIRDKVNSKYKFDFKTTDDIIKNINLLPDKMMFTIHPQRWNDAFLPWMKELVWQTVKNMVKWFINKKR